jgi:DNA-binding response OmpR family regulator
MLYHCPLCIGGGTIRAVRILVIDGDEAPGTRVATALEEAGFDVVTATSALDGLKKLYQAYPDAIIMARQLAMVNGEDAYLRIRQASYLPIIVLGNREDLAESLESGADVFMTNPPSPRELVARVRRLLQRRTGFDTRQNNPELNMENDPPLGEGNGLSYFSPTEFRLASCMILNKGRLLDYSRLIDEVWGGKEVTLDTLHFYMRRLRNKLQVFFPNHINIINYRGVGYRLEEVIQ